MVGSVVFCSPSSPAYSQRRSFGLMLASSPYLGSMKDRSLELSLRRRFLAWRVRWSLPTHGRTSRAVGTKKKRSASLMQHDGCVQSALCKPPAVIVNICVSPWCRHGVTLVELVVVILGPFVFVLLWNVSSRMRARLPFPSLPDRQAGTVYREVEQRQTNSRLLCRRGREGEARSNIAAAWTPVARSAETVRDQSPCSPFQGRPARWRMAGRRWDWGGRKLKKKLFGSMMSKPWNAPWCESMRWAAAMV